MKEDMHRAFGSSLSLQSTLARSSSRDLSFLEGRASISSNLALPSLALPRVAVADVLTDSNDGKQCSPGSLVCLNFCIW